jgi:hypothetical protein
MTRPLGDGSGEQGPAEIGVVPRGMTESKPIRPQAANTRAVIAAPRTVGQ